MDQNRLLLLVRILLVFNLLFSLNTSSGHPQNVRRTLAELSTSTAKSLRTRNSALVNKEIGKGDGDFVGAFTSPAGMRRVTGNSQARVLRRRGSNLSWEADEESHTVATRPGVGAESVESATAAAHRAFRTYLERSDYFRSQRSEYFPSLLNMPSIRANSAPVHASISPSRRKLASTIEPAPLEGSRIGQNSKILEQPFMYLVVSQAGDGDFTTVQDAVDFIPENNPRRVIVRIRAGFYRERVVVPKNKPFIMFLGDGSRTTIISWNATAASLLTAAAQFWDASEEVALFGTMQSASVTVLSDFFVAQNIAFQNSAPAPNPGAENSQAVAFLIAGDSAAFYDCSFLGAQDTLYDYKGRHYYHRCFIQGSIDFIFGNGRTLFENCTLSSIATRFGAIAAQQRRTPDQDTGFAFVGCYVTGTGSVYLGRAWSPFAKIVFAHSYFEDIIDAEGWSDFGDPARHETTYFGMYDCSGPGANPARFVPWSRNLTVDEVRPYLGQSYVNGEEWLVDRTGDNSTLTEDSVNP